MRSSEARLRLRQGHVGSGTLEGLGFYLDPSMRVQNADTGATSEGFVAPFAYLRFSLVDLGSGQLVRERAVTASHTASSQEALAPWQALTADEKVRILQGLIRAETARAMREIIARP